mgnify:CR=1 FL=1
MENKMFCFQCEQTAGCSGCTGKVGVCGKNADVAALQDKLTGELIGLVRATGDVVPTGNVLKLIIEGLFTTLTNVSFNEQTLNELIEKFAQKEKGLFRNVLLVHHRAEQITNMICRIFGQIMKIFAV